MRCAPCLSWCGPGCCSSPPGWAPLPARWRWRCAESLENAPPGPGAALRAHGVGKGRLFLYATLPQVLPQLLSYTLYRWENNIRAAAVLGVVGAGGLGQLLSFHMGLFHMGKTATILGAMLLLVALVDALSYGARRWLTR
jgi:phosphonate transport system permease protein